jgi:tripartite-type tricarboxylate transporter receptor subunit TctC
MAQALSDAAGALHRAGSARRRGGPGGTVYCRVHVGSFSQRVYVENRSGANGIIGIEAAARSAPDGHTVLVTSNVVMTNPYAYKINTDPLKDLTPVIQLSRQPYVLAV